MSASEGCINIDSYGVICVHCGCCEQYNPNAIDRTERQIRYYEERLEEQYNFDEFDEIEKFAEIQRNNIKDNIVFYTEKIKQLKHLLGEMRSDVDG